MDVYKNLYHVTCQIIPKMKKGCRVTCIKVLVLAERIKKKSAPGKFFKQSVQKISYFNKEKTFLIRKKQKIDKITYYWLKNTETNRKAAKRFARTELFALFLS